MVFSTLKWSIKSNSPGLVAVDSSPTSSNSKLPDRLLLDCDSEEAMALLLIDFTAKEEKTKRVSL